MIREIGGAGHTGSETAAIEWHVHRRVSPGFRGNLSRFLFGSTVAVARISPWRDDWAMDGHQGRLEDLRRYAEQNRTWG